MVIHGRRMEEDDHSSMFETSHVLGALMASSPLVMQSWSLCSRANLSGGSSIFLAEEHDGVFYVAFSGVLNSTAAQPTADVDFFGGTGSGFFGLIPIDRRCGNELFAPLAGGEGDDDDQPQPVLVQAGALHLFLNLYHSPEFQMLKSQTTEKAVIFTGHSIGGSLASIAALHFLCSSSSSSSSSSPSSLMCITFGAPLLGNEGLSRAVLRERWGGNFCHVVAQRDVVPRLLLCPINHSSSQLAGLLACMMRSWPPELSRLPALEVSDEQNAELKDYIVMYLSAAAAAAAAAAAPEQDISRSSKQLMMISPYKPFGNYVLCSKAGAVCADDALVVMKMLYLTFAATSEGFSIEEEHLSYGDVVVKVLQNLLVKKRFDGEEEGLSSNYSAGVSLALEASGIPIQDMAATEALECFEMSKRICRHPNLRCASLAVRLAKVTPCRAQIEWYKALCDDASTGGAASPAMGYYDCFKLRRSPKRDAKVNMNRIKLAQFWNDLIGMLQRNELPHDFHRRSKWVNAAHFYKLLVEPLDIAEYYRQRRHKKKGHYLPHGRARRFEVFDRWWSEASKKEDSCQAKAAAGRRRRSKFAGLTQDSCFWAKVEEAMDWLENAEAENDPAKVAEIWEKLRSFEDYAKELIGRKEVSKDALAPRSSYSHWVEKWKELQLKHSSKMP